MAFPEKTGDESGLAETMNSIGAGMDALGAETEKPKDSTMAADEESSGAGAMTIEQAYEKCRADPKYGPALEAAEAASDKDTVIGLLKKIKDETDEPGAMVEGFASEIDMKNPPKRPMDLMGPLGSYKDKKGAPAM